MATIKSGVESDHRFSFTSLNGHAYFCNGWDKMMRWNGIDAAAVDAGIDAAPSDWAPTPTTAAGNCTPGKHLIRYRYLSRDTQYISNPSNQVEITIAAGAERLTFPIAATSGANIKRSTDTKADRIVFEMTFTSGAVFFEAEVVDTTASSVVINLSDDTLAGKLLDYTDDGHDPPQFFSVVLAHKGRLLGCGRVKHEKGTAAVTNASTSVVGTGTNWTDSALSQFFKVAGDADFFQIGAVGGVTSITLATPYTGSTASGVSYEIFSVGQNTIFESKPLFPESWPPLNFTKALVNKNDRIRAMIAHFGTIIVCGDFSTERWSYTQSLVDDGQPFPIPGERGALNQRCVIEVDGIVYGWDRQGIWKYSGGPQQHISHAVDPLWQIMRFSVVEEFHTVFVPIERCIRFYWVRDDDDVTDTKSKDFLEYNIDKAIWATGRHAMAMSSSATIGSTNERRAILGDENGHSWFVVGSTEGADPDFTLDGLVAAAPGPTATVFTITGGGLVTTNGGLAGVPVFWREGNEERLVASNTATQITLASGFTVAPDAGDTIHIGRIKSILRTKAISITKLSSRYRQRYLHVYFEPTSVAKELRVRFFEDYAAAAKAWDITAVDLTAGVDITAGTTDFRIDMSVNQGYARIPLGLDWNRVIEVEFQVWEQDTGLNLIGFEIDGMADQVERL